MVITMINWVYLTLKGCGELIDEQLPGIESPLPPSR